MDIKTIFKDCSETTKSKGFDTSNIVAQLLLMGTEVGEALELFQAKDPDLEAFRQVLIGLCQRVEEQRRERKWDTLSYELQENSYDGMLEELADVLIRIASFIEGNGWTERFLNKLQWKMEVNRGRPYLHGKEN